MPSMRKSYFACVAASCQDCYVFGFDALLVKVYLDTSGPLHLGFHSTAAGMGGGAPGSPFFRMASGDSPLTIADGIPMGAMVYGCTSTDLAFRVWALGG